MNQIQVPKGWDLTKLGEVSKVVSGAGFPLTHQKEVNRGIPFIKVSDMNHPDNSKYMKTYSFFVNQEILKKIKATVYPKNTIIFPKVGGALLTNKRRILSEAACFDNNIMGLIPGNSVDHDFLYYFMLKTKLNEWAREKAPIPSIKQSTVELIEFPLPPLEIQKKIVQKLDHVFAQLEEKKRKILTGKKRTSNNLEQIKRRLFRYFISKTIPYYKTNGLDEKPFSAITKSYDNLRIPLNRSQRSTIQGIYPYYGASGQVDSINDYKFDGRFLLVAEDGENLNSQKKPIAYIVKGKFWVNNHAHVVQTTDEVDLGYLCYYLNGLNIMDYAKKQATRPKLKKSDMDKISIVFPKIDEQKRIISRIQKVEKGTDSITDNLSKILQRYEIFLQEINQLNLSILDKAFSGKLVN